MVKGQSISTKILLLILAIREHLQVLFPLFMMFSLGFLEEPFSCGETPFCPHPAKETQNTNIRMLNKNFVFDIVSPLAFNA